MFGFKRKVKKEPTVVEQRTAYKQVAVTPEAHAKLRALADKKGLSMIDTFSNLVGA